MGKLKCGCVTADAKNTISVRYGYEQGGYTKSFCDYHKAKTMAKKTDKPTEAKLLSNSVLADLPDSNTRHVHKVRRTVPRYVYHVSGHAKLHAPHRPNAGADSQQVPQAVPFEVVTRRPSPITCDEDMEALRRDVRNHVQAELKRADSPYLVGDTMIRGVSFLHLIYVDCDDPKGAPARVLTQGA